MDNTNERAFPSELVPTGDGGWLLPFSKNVLVDGHLVPAARVDLYKRMLKSYGHLVCDSVVPCSPFMQMSIVNSTMETIAEIESMKDTELSRYRLDRWFQLLDILSNSGFSKKWLGYMKPQAEELDRAFHMLKKEKKKEIRRLEFVEEFRGEDPELADKMMEVIRKRDAKLAKDRGRR